MTPGPAVVERGSGAARMTAPIPLSIAILCRDNEPTIGRTLDSLAGLGAEIVALDSGSTDGTLDLLERAGARIERIEWAGMARTRQMSLDACARPWVLCLDSDESLTPPLRENVERAMRQDDPAVGGYLVNRKVWWAGAFLEHTWQPEWRLRLVRREFASAQGDEPHDEIVLRAGAGRIERLAGDLRHDAIGDLHAFMRKQAALAQKAAIHMHGRGGRSGPLRLITSPIAAWTKQAILRGGWRDGWRGWCAASAVAASTLMKHAMLVERSNMRPEERR